ncbi:MAG: FAD-dependent monooxygenase [Phycisphaerae bacterium]|nr:FAD-dependent monooxygenase [Phycisphaerae bacterium]
MTPAKKQDNEVAVIGAGPAGATAALCLARLNRRVVIVDAAKYPRKYAMAGWINSRVAGLLSELGVNTKTLLTRPFKRVTFHNEDFSKSATPAIRDTAGYLIDRCEFGNLMAKAAQDAGARLVSGKKVVQVRPQEDAVQIGLEDGEDISGRLLVMAAGRGSPLAQAVGVSRTSSEPPVLTAQIDAPIKGGKDADESRVGVVLGLERRGSFVMYWTAGSTQTVSMNWYGDPNQAASRFVQVCRVLAERELIPVDVSGQAGKSVFARSPAAAALDMDTHVGKHTLMIGDAGGFVCAMSNEGIYPAMWSATIAAEVVNAALDSVHSQDELIRFNTEWRMKMADYLRSPNTDSQFLVPLIFSNQPMADRMAAAFFSGENI